MDENLVHEIEAVQAKIDALSKRKPFQLHPLMWQLGLFFFLILLISKAVSGVFAQVIQLVSFAVIFVTLLKVSADILFYKRKNTSYMLLAIVFLIIIVSSYFLVWQSVFLVYILFFWFILSIYLLLITGFYALHALLSYHRQSAKNECVITGVLVLSAWALLLVSVLYKNALTFFLLLVALLIVSKAMFDFSQRFVRKE